VVGSWYPSRSEGFEDERVVAAEGAGSLPAPDRRFEGGPGPVEGIGVRRQPDPGGDRPPP
ncbi:MAG: hypothetical protein ACOC5I_01790, partial [Gemmatimonadota bacterium]